METPEKDPSKPGSRLVINNETMKVVTSWVPKNYKPFDANRLPSMKAGHEGKIGPTSLEGVEADWSKGLVISAAYKGDRVKKVCLVNVGNKPLVLKAASGTPRAHVANTNFIRSLDLPGVSAPISRFIAGNEKDEILASLRPMRHDAHVDELIQALETGDAQVSVPSKHPNLDKVILGKNIIDAKDRAIALRSQLLQGSEGEADLGIKAFKVIKEILTGNDLKDTPNSRARLNAPKELEKLNGFVRELEKLNGFVKNKGIDGLINYLQSKEDYPLRLEFAKVLSEAREGLLTQSLESAKSERDARGINEAKLKEFVKSDKGITAFASMAAVDLIAGMEDRFLGDWNGGNFQFDPDEQKLICIDNAKTPQWTLSADNSDAWKKEFTTRAVKSESLEDVIFRKIFEPPTNGAPDSPGCYTDFDDFGKTQAKTLIRKTIKKVLEQAGSNSEGDQGSPIVRQRVNFLKDKLALDAFIRKDPDGALAQARTRLIQIFVNPPPNALAPPSLVLPVGPSGSRARIDQTSEVEMRGYAFAALTKELSVNLEQYLSETDGRLLRELWNTDEQKGEFMGPWNQAKIDWAPAVANAKYYSDVQLSIERQWNALKAVVEKPRRFD